MLDRDQFSQLFEVGEVIESGAGAHRKDAANLKILAIENEFIRYQSLKSASKNRIRYSYLQMLIDSFDELDQQAIQKSVNEVLKKAGFPANYSTENYSYTLAKAYHQRRNKMFLLFGEESSAVESFLAIDGEFIEGARVSVQVERIERDVRARKKCIDHFGAVCCACDFNFEIAYGPIGKGFIHVHHHRTQLAKLSGALRRFLKPS